MDRQTLFGAVFRHRGVLLLGLSIPIAVTALRGGGLVPELALSGLAIVASGVWLRLLAMRQIGRSARVRRAGARQGIVWSGPYRWTRNPLYLAAMLMLCGLALVAGNPTLAAILVPLTLLAYTPIVLVEENTLRGLPGDDYQRYFATVPRWIGFPRRSQPAQSSVPRADWREVFHRERGLVPWTLFALAGIAAIRAEWIPFASLARRVEQILGFDLALVVIAVMVVAIAGSVTNVEVRAQRKHAARAEARSQL
jgi:protein-S-isoprenylcysteine O-methyltransferase Ste14